MRSRHPLFDAGITTTLLCLRNLEMPIVPEEPQQVQRLAIATIPRQEIGISWILVVTFLVLVVSQFLASQSHGDELVLDESLTELQTVGDLFVSACSAPIATDQAGCFDAEGEISAGQLYAFFKKQGLDSVHEIRLSLDIDPRATRLDYELNAIEFIIDDSKYSIGNNSILLPAYEASDMKPEAQIAIKLDYDFMQKFNENSKQKVKLDYLVNGQKQGGSPVKVAAFAETSNFSMSRMFFVTAFAGFWLVVFIVLFRTTTPKSTNRPTNAASPA